MRVVIVGASGNHGTALLRRVRREMVSPGGGGITSVVGVARRVPRGTPPPPYDIAQWQQCDIGQGEDEDVVRRLTEIFTGADAVVHLAWLIQPSHQRQTLRRVNVDGTRRVTEAVARAGVPHLVAASSVGAYSPVLDDAPRDETWPTGGIRTSDYSVDKAAQEALLDELDLSYPAVTVARVRPALTFQAAAGAEIGRYFLGTFVPTSVLAPGRLPLLPWPRGLRLQVVHSDDLAEAYYQVLVRRAGGAFNIAADDVLRAAEAAEVLSRGRRVEVPAAPVRFGIWVAWAARLLPIGPGWFDMGQHVPVLDSGRAHEVLGWRPVHDPLPTLAELLDAIAAGQGTASPPMRPRRRPIVDSAPPVR